MARTRKAPTVEFIAAEVPTSPIGDGLDTMPIKELRELARTELSTGSRLLRKAEIIPALRKFREDKANAAARVSKAVDQIEKGIPRVSRVERIASEIKNQHVAGLVEAVKERSGKRATVAPVQPADPWGGITMGNVIYVSENSVGDQAFYFLVSKIDPTRKGGELAWVTGQRCNGKGKPLAQVSMLHCPDGMRMELLHIDHVKLALR